MTTNELFDNLEDGEEYISLLCTKEVYRLIPKEVASRIVLNYVRQKNESFKDDAEHKEYVKALRKAKKDLQNYEYKKNQL